MLTINTGHAQDGFAARIRRNRKNVWNDIAITDKELASKLAALKINTNHLAIKAMRYWS